MTEDWDRLDDLLDRALAVYGNCEPRPGLDGRILAALRAARPPRPWWQGLLGLRLVPVSLGVVALAGTVVSIVLTRGGARVVTSSSTVAIPTPPTPQTGLAPPSTPPAAQAGRSADRLPVREAPTGPAAQAPRRPSFPSAVPLSEQEQLLVRYVSEAPREEVEPRADFLSTPASLPALPDPATTP